MSVFNKCLTAALVALVIAPAGLAQGDAMTIARAYLAAYEAQDYDAMRGFYAEDAHFIDPTSFDIESVAVDIDWTGPDAIIEGIRAWGMARGEYRIDRSYEASGRVVFLAEMDVIYAVPDGEVVFRYPITTIITVRDGQVVEHRDYTDFQHMHRVESD